MWRLRGAAASETVPPEVAAASNNRIGPLNKAEALARTVASSEGHFAKIKVLALGSPRRILDFDD
jgi:hypothetical protein